MHLTTTLDGEIAHFKKSYFVSFCLLLEVSPKYD